MKHIAYIVLGFIVISFFFLVGYALENYGETLEIIISIIFVILLSWVVGWYVAMIVKR
jgi:hypothetical protein